MFSCWEFRDLSYVAICLLARVSFAYACSHVINSKFIFNMEEAKRLHDLIRKELRGCTYPRASILEPLYAEVVELVGEEGAPTWAVLRSSSLLESLVEMAGV